MQQIDLPCGRMVFQSRIKMHGGDECECVGMRMPFCRNKFVFPRKSSVRSVCEMHCLDMMGACSQLLGINMQIPIWLRIVPPPKAGEQYERTAILYHQQYTSKLGDIQQIDMPCGRMVFRDLTFR